MSVSNYFSFLQKILEIVPFTLSDLLFFIFLILYVASERQRQFIQSLLTFIFTWLVVLLALGSYGLLSSFMQEHLILSKGVADGGSFLLMLTIFSGIAIVGYKLILLNTYLELSRYKLSVMTALMGAGTFIVITSCIVTMLLSFPITPFIKNVVNNSLILSNMTTSLQTLESFQYRIFSKPSTSLLNFLVNTPRQPSQITVATNGSLIPAEQEGIALFEMINKKRVRTGSPALVQEEELSLVATTLAQNISTSQAFSQSTVRGVTPFDILTNARVPYTTAYFIPIYAQSKDLAFNGVKQIPEYHQHLISSKYSRIGVGSVWLKEHGFIFTLLLAD